MLWGLLNTGLVAVACFSSTTTWAAEVRRPPNIVVFLADDAGWGDFSHSGNQTVQTPHIDSIAMEGVSLQRFFVCPVCAPTRAEFLTGRYHPRGGVQGVSTGFERLDPRERTLADDLKSAGYATGAFGKWHNGSQWPYHPQARGFDEYFGHTAGHWGEYFDAPLEDQGRMVATKGYIVDVCTDRALSFIERNSQQPFFCFVPFTTPHSPWAAPEDDWQRFRERPIAQTATPSEREVIEQTRCALAMLENQDRNVGRVLDKLRELQLERDTIVLYFSDNGPNSWRWNGAMKGRKGSTDEGGIRSVAYIRWPATLPAGHVVSSISGAIDLRPTLLGLASIEPLTIAKGEESTSQQLPLDGIDLGPLLKNDRDWLAANPWPKRKLFSKWGQQVSVGTDQYRLDNNGNLFDIQSDPGQTKALNNTLPDVLSELSSEVQRWRQEMNEALGAQLVGATSGVDPRPFPVGYREFPITMLPARDGEPNGTIRRSSAAPNCSYFVNWSSPDDSATWNIEVVEAGRFRVAIDYTCAEKNKGVELVFRFAGTEFRGRVDKSWDPPLFTNQDTLPRPDSESPMKPFQTLELGEWQLPAATGSLVLTAGEIPGDGVVDLRRIILERIAD